MRTIVLIACLCTGVSAAWGQSVRLAGGSPRSTLEVVQPSPATAAALGRIEEYLWKESRLGPRVAGLLALITAREMSLAYEWSAREDAALRAGLEPPVVVVV